MMLLKGIDIWLPKIVKVIAVKTDTENKGEDKNKEKRKGKKDE